jgi:hypothetical protein
MERTYYTHPDKSHKPHILILGHCRPPKCLAISVHIDDHFDPAKFGHKWLWLKCPVIMLYSLNHLLRNQLLDHTAVINSRLTATLGVHYVMQHQSAVSYTVTTTLAILLPSKLNTRGSNILILISMFQFVRRRLLSQ